MEARALHVSLKKQLPPGMEPGGPPPFASQAGWLKGGPECPLLAPRGICFGGSSLLAADTGQNRVLIWKTPEASKTDSPPDLVLGQREIHQTGRNAGHAASADSLHYPSGIWSDGQRLIIADAWNHRVLLWLRFPERSGQAADVVLGQPDFDCNQPNVRGIGAAPSERSLYWPYGVHSDGERLWIADTGNRRILFFESIPTESYAAAAAVIGKSSFFERDYSPSDALWPYSVQIGPGGEMAVCDPQAFRVLLWPHWQQAFSQPAQVLIGQPDFESNGPNQYGPCPQAHTLNWCYGACFYGQGLLLADTANSRLLWFETLPEHSNAPAQNLIGKPDFFTGSENMASALGTESSLYWPFSLAVSGHRLAVADTGNHRIVFYDLPSL
jgi:hypothetical protein